MGKLSRLAWEVEKKRTFGNIDVGGTWGAIECSGENICFKFK
jgi:hypothetical protein